MALLKCFAFLACMACCSAQSMQLQPGMPDTLVPDLPYNPHRLPRPCTLTCGVRVISGRATVREIQVLWERQLQDNYYALDSRALSDYTYPAVTCEEMADPGVIGCDLEIGHCTNSLAGNYRCTITNLVDKTTVSRTVALSGLENDFVPPQCYTPSVSSFSAIMRSASDGGSLEVSWELSTKNSAAISYCKGSRDWRLRYHNFSTPYDVNDHIAPNPDHFPPSSWVGMRRVNSYMFPPGEINEITYYVFQLQIQDIIENPRIEYTDHDGIFTSYIYYFGLQIPPQLITPNHDVHVTQGHDVTLSCDAIGQPTPSIRLLKGVAITAMNVAIPNQQLAKAYIVNANSEDDAGTYVCYAKNIQVGPPLGKRTKVALHEIELYVDNPIVEDEGSSVTCTTYDKNTCSPYLENVNIFLNYTALTDDSDYDFAERSLNNMTSVAFLALRAHSELPIDSTIQTQCISFAEAILCHTFYPYCASTPDLPSPQLICNHTCAVLTDGPCRGLLDAHSTDADVVELQRLLISNCDARVKPAGDAPECFAMSFPVPESSATFAEEELEYSWCLEGEGQNYNGDVSRTSSGEQCQSWQSQQPHSHPVTSTLYPVLEGAGHVCRNPGGLGSQPWCYTSTAGYPQRWEYCHVPVCELCVPYAGGFCSGLEGYGSGEEVYLNRKVWEEENPDVEAWMADRFNSLGGLELFPGCANAVKQLLCFTALPLCNENDHASPREMCSEHCLLLADASYCPANRVGPTRLASIWKVLPAPDCSGVPASQSSNCLPAPVRITLPDDFTPTEHYYNSTDYGQGYRGVVARSSAGISCQRWDSSFPHPHSFTAEDGYPELAGAENHCRNPGQIRREPWCFTTNRSIEWQYCNIPNENEFTGVLATAASSAATLPASSDDSGTVGAIITVGLLGVCTIVGITIAVMFYCVIRARKQKYRLNPRNIKLGTRTVEQFHGNSAELKLSYNQNYSLHSSVLANYESVIKTFPKFDKAKVKYIKQLGQGNFGVVFQGEATGLIEGENETIVAVKTLKEELKEAIVSFIHEVKLMFSFDHPNVLKIYAVCMEDPPFYMLTEFMDKGDLSKFLRDNASSFQRRYLNPSIRRSRTESNISNDPAALTATQLTDVCKQIAAGMEYLSGKKHIHRDLACRNCLVKSEGDSESGLTIKIGDFGMSHNLYSQSYFRVKGHAVLPIRWMAPESVTYGKFTTAGDVYSFGVVMWEVFSFAMQPYFGKTNDEVADAIRKGHLLSRPADCPQQIYEIMLQCWNGEPDARPDFAELHSNLNECRSSVSSSSDERLSESGGDHTRSMNSVLSDDAFYDSVCGKELDPVTA